MAFPIIGAIAAVGAAKAVSDLWAGNQKAKAAKRAGREALRRFDLQNATTLGAATARAHASGLNLSPIAGDGTPQSSMGTFLGQMAAEFKREHNYALSEIRRGEKLSQIANGLNFATNLTSTFFSMGHEANWWQAGPQPESPTYTPGQGMPLWRP